MDDLAEAADANLRALVGAALQSGHPADVTLELIQRRAHTMSEGAWVDNILFGMVRPEVAA